MNDDPLTSPPQADTPSLTPPAKPAFDPLKPAAPPPNSPSSPLAPQHPETQKGKLGLVLVICAVLVATAAASGSTYLITNKARATSESNLKKEIARLEKPMYMLPAGAKKVSDCVPSMGIHYLLKDSDPEYGPYVITNKAGMVLGVEYMASSDMYTAIPNTDPPVQLVAKDSPVFGWKIDHAEISHMPQGDLGLKRELVDVHLYTTSMEESMDACK